MSVSDNKEMSKEELLSLWGEDGLVTCHSICLPLPTTDYPPSYLQETFGSALPEEVVKRDLFSVFTAYEDQHPEYKGTLTKWKVLRCEIYPGTKDCAYDAFVVCYCDRLPN